MEILIEKIDALGLVQSKRSVKLPKSRMVITIGDKRFFVNNLADKPVVDRIEPDITKIQENFADNL